MLTPIQANQLYNGLYTFYAGLEPQAPVPENAPPLEGPVYVAVEELAAIVGDVSLSATLADMCARALGESDIADQNVVPFDTKTISHWCEQNLGPEVFVGAGHDEYGYVIYIKMEALKRLTAGHVV